MTENSRAHWVLTTPFFDSREARLRAAWHYLVRRHRYEICGRCGRPVGPHTGSWWQASDDLWMRVAGSRHRVLCPPCFTALADGLDTPIRWEAVHDA